jgi:ribulose 1,5-bisphosphate carboxylase large subunit-like protein
MLLGFNAYIESKPASKAPIYKEIKKYSPYYLEKRFGGLEIRSKDDENFKEKPSNMEIFHRIEALEKEWGKKYLKIKENKLYIYNSNHNLVKKIDLKTKEDLSFIHKYYGI